MLASCLWLAVQHRPDELCDAINDFRPSQDAFYALKEFFLTTPIAELRDIDVVKLGAMKMTLHGISHNGSGAMAGGPQGGRDGGHKITSRWNPKKLCQLVPQLHELIARKDVKITNLDFKALIVAPGDCVHYLDPPYIAAGPSLYVYPFAAADHLRLRDALRCSTNPWVLSYDPPARPLYDFAQVKTIARNELLITPHGCLQLGATP
jgi:DNA adenine methylase